MQKVNQKYRQNITEVYKIITMLPESERNKIPVKVQEFFKENSNLYLLNNIEMNSDIIRNNLSLTTKKFLKIIELYLYK